MKHCRLYILRKVILSKFLLGKQILHIEFKTDSFWQHSKVILGHYIVIILLYERIEVGGDQRGGWSRFQKQERLVREDVVVNEIILYNSIFHYSTEETWNNCSLSVRIYEVMHNIIVCVLMKATVLRNITQNCTICRAHPLLAVKKIPSASEEFTSYNSLPPLTSVLSNTQMRRHPMISVRSSCYSTACKIQRL